MLGELQLHAQHAPHRVGEVAICHSTKEASPEVLVEVKADVVDAEDGAQEAVAPYA